MRLLLFDIDGTLLDCGGQTHTLFADTLIEVFGTAGGVASYSFAGRTDPQIVLDLMTGAGMAAEDVHGRIPEMRDRYLPRLEQTLDRRSMRLLPNVEELLERLAPRPDVQLALLTGNWEGGARTKLSRFGLNRFFSFGAYGCDGVHRSDLPPVALARAAAHLGRAVAPSEALIIGDSIYDVSCAHDHGIPVLAVATGRTSAAELAAAGADRVVPDLNTAFELILG
jgi:phosphoglycolate phosphatase-like HAD superfamily hydrolase